MSRSLSRRAVLTRGSAALAAVALPPISMTRSVSSSTQRPLPDGTASQPLDVVIVGAGTAGLAAALILGRSRRRTVVLDGGPPRNAPAHSAYGVFTRDGTPPQELLRLARADLRPYPSVEVREALASGVSGADGDFAVALEGGTTLRTRKVILATGVVDELPDVPGVAELWGGDLFHCPYCHGWEVRDRALGMWSNNAHTAEVAVLLRGWSTDITVLTDGPSTLDNDETTRLEALGIPIREDRVAALEHEGDALRAVRFQDGSRLALGGVMVSVPQHERSGIPAVLGCETGETGHVATDASGETSVPGVFAVGDLASPGQAVTLAAADGAGAAYALNRHFAHADADRVAQTAPAR